MVKGVALFFEEHMERMRNSGSASGIALRKEDREILDEISTLVERNQCPETNAKLVCARVGEEEVFLTYFIASEDPGPQGLEPGGAYHSAPGREKGSPRQTGEQFLSGNGTGCDGKGRRL